ncbi:MAG: hypothetical protein CM15mP3_06630 [Candidatus Poseidoniales archaeon]|nr:MAG: hypothetical protein CM15mP3_06630 [Candidatus Poseidoniales archaeon]
MRSFFSDDNGRLFVEGFANDQEKSILMTLNNNGNDEESYNISVTNDFPLKYRQSGHMLIPHNHPYRVGWFLALLPQITHANCLPEGFYEVVVTATNVDDPSLTANEVIPVEIRKTASVHVETDISDQSYIPGDIAQSMKFEVTNNGNIADTFDMSLNLPQGMNAQFTNLVDGQFTPIIDSGASYNVTVEFSFDTGISGNLQMVIIGKSVYDSTVIATGGSTYSVGSSNQWLKILPSQQVIIDNFEDEVVLEVTVRNQYSTAQSVSMDIDYGNSSSWYKSRIDSSDRQFVLGTGDDSVRVVTIRFEVTEDTLMTLENPIFDSEIILWARSDTVSDAAQSNIQVQLRKIIVDTGEDTSGGFDFVGAATWLGFIVIIVGGIVITVRILRSVEEEEDEYANWGQDGYQDSLTSTYQSVISAPTVPSGPPASVPASMPPQMPAEPVTAPSVAPAPMQEVVQPTEAPVQTGPPLPETGLPAGWTMEQWNAYGEMWLSQNQQN